MSRLQESVAQIWDKLADIVKGPAVGLVTITPTATATLATAGLLGTLPDGRIVRVRRPARLVSGVPIDLHARLSWLAPAAPRAGNFAPVTTSTTVTWTLPPTGVPATGAVKAPGFARTSRAILDSLALGDRDDESFAAGTQGLVQAQLMPPQVRAVPPTFQEPHRSIGEVTWRLRVAIASSAPLFPIAVTSNDVLEAISGALMGARIGEGHARFVDWTPVQRRAEQTHWVYTFRTHVLLEGRSVVEPTLQAPDLTQLGAEVRLPEHGAQSPNFIVSDDVALSSGD